MVSLAKPYDGSICISSHDALYNAGVDDLHGVVKCWKNFEVMYGPFKVFI